ncbi:unnamed protein product, partial [Protopolystoma xenopodis]
QVRVATTLRPKHLHDQSDPPNIHSVHPQTYLQTSDSLRRSPSFSQRAPGSHYLPMSTAILIDKSVSPTSAASPLTPTPLPSSASSSSSHSCSSAVAPPSNTSTHCLASSADLVSAPGDKISRSSLHVSEPRHNRHQQRSSKQGGPHIASTGVVRRRSLGAVRRRDVGHEARSTAISATTSDADGAGCISLSWQEGQKAAPTEARLA